jgi:hypothetical protein
VGRVGERCLGRLLGCQVGGVWPLCGYYVGKSCRRTHLVAFYWLAMCVNVDNLG